MQLRSFLGILLLAALWGPSFLFIKVALVELKPFTIVAGRVGIGGILLYIALKIIKGKIPMKWSLWKHFVIVGAIGNAIPFTLFSWGEQYIDSALASIVNGTTPLFTIVIAHFVISDDRLTLPKTIGSVIGFGGLIVLVAPSLVGGFEATTLGLIAVTVAALCYGITIVYTKTYLRGLPKLVAPTAQLFAATIWILPMVYLLELPLPISEISLKVSLSVLGLAVLGTSLAYIVYYRLLETTPATYLSMVTYLIPVFGVILGMIVLGEKLEWNAWLGCLLILFGVMIVNGVIKLPFVKAKPI